MAIWFYEKRKYKSIKARRRNVGLNCARHDTAPTIFLDMKLVLVDKAELLVYLNNDPALRLPVQVIFGNGGQCEQMELGTLISF